MKNITYIYLTTLFISFVFSCDKNKRNFHESGFIAVNHDDVLFRLMIGQNFLNNLVFSHSDLPQCNLG